MILIYRQMAKEGDVVAFKGPFGFENCISSKRVAERLACFITKLLVN